MTADDRSGFAERLVDLVAADAGATAAAIDQYFAESYTGSRFEFMADANPHRITANDIVAVSMLGVDVPAAVAVWLLSDEGQAVVSDLLGLVPATADIWEEPSLVAPGSDLWRMWEVLETACWPAARAGNGMGPTTISKVLAAKRPRLVPITDAVVVKVLPSSGHWADFAEALSNERVRSPIEDATASAPAHLSLLRRIDIAIWMLHH